MARTFHKKKYLIQIRCRKYIYLFSMYTGIRAVWNLVLNILVRSNQAQAILKYLHRSFFVFEKMGPFKCYLHFRPPPVSQFHGKKYGMISARLLHPQINSVIYRYFCLTSHFGSGHIEAAFYVENGNCVIYAMRNTAKSNAVRLGWRRTGKNLSLGKAEEIVMFELFSRALKRFYSKVYLASPHESLLLAVDKRLLHPEKREKSLDIFKRRYEKIYTKLCHPISS